MADSGVCRHPDNWFDRELCPSPCDTMHTRCVECGAALDFCSNESEEPLSDQRCGRCRNYLRICGHDLPLKERMKSTSLQTGWAKGIH